MNRYLTDDGYLTIPAVMKLNKFARRAYMYNYPFISRDRKLTNYAVEWCELNNIDRFELHNNIMLQNNNLVEVN